MFRKTSEQVELGGAVIPKDTAVRVHMWEIQHDPDTWSSPETFDPERFAPGGEAERVASEGLAWLPFSSGSRVCIGQNFSMAEQRVFLSLIRMCQKKESTLILSTDQNWHVYSAQV